ncbi:hypothetical protein TNCV_901611 [Trichonephila clavipes]|nr:hypothetical protein TNCV_901611 [Trichonephila clavipes]
MVVSASVGNSGSQKVECTVVPGSGRPRNTNDREDRAIEDTASAQQMPDRFNAGTVRLPDIQCHQEKP